MPLLLIWSMMVSVVIATAPEGGASSLSLRRHHNNNNNNNRRRPQQHESASFPGAKSLSRVLKEEDQGQQQQQRHHRRRNQRVTNFSRQSADPIRAYLDPFMIKLYDGIDPPQEISERLWQREVKLWVEGTIEQYIRESVEEPIETVRLLSFTYESSSGSNDKIDTLTFEGGLVQFVPSSPNSQARQQKDPENSSLWTIELAPYSSHEVNVFAKSAIDNLLFETYENYNNNFDMDITDAEYISLTPEPTQTPLVYEEDQAAPPPPPLINAASKDLHAKDPRQYGIISGSVIGGVALLVIVMGLFLWRDRKRRRDPATKADNSSPLASFDGDESDDFHGKPPSIQVQDRNKNNNKVVKFKGAYDDVLLEEEDGFSLQTTDQVVRSIHASSPTAVKAAAAAAMAAPPPASVQDDEGSVWTLSTLNTQSIAANSHADYYNRDRSVLSIHTTESFERDRQTTQLKKDMLSNTQWTAAYPDAVGLGPGMIPAKNGVGSSSSSSKRDGRDTVLQASHFSSKNAGGTPAMVTPAPSTDSSSFAPDSNWNPDDDNSNYSRPQSGPAAQQPIFQVAQGGAGNNSDDEMYLMPPSQTRKSRSKMVVNYEEATTTTGGSDSIRSVSSGESSRSGGSGSSRQNKKKKSSTSRSTTNSGRFA